MRVLFTILASIAMVQAQNCGDKRGLVTGPAEVQCLNGEDQDCFKELEASFGSYLGDRRLRGRRELQMSCGQCQQIYGFWFCVFQNVCRRRLNTLFPSAEPMPVDEPSDPSGSWVSDTSSETLNVEREVYETVNTKFTSLNELEAFKSIDIIMQTYVCE